MMMSKTAIIFGVTGQDGSYLAEQLISKEYNVYGVARRTSTGNVKNIKHILEHPRFELVTGDVTDSFFVNNIITKMAPDEVYNLAAQSHVGVSFDNPQTTFEITFGGTFNILNAIRLSESEGTRMYQASSSEMFGSKYETQFTCDPNFPSGIYLEQYQDENTRMIPNSPYAVAKLAAHNMCRVYRQSYGIHVSCGILFNHESERRGEHFVTRKVTKYVAKLSDWLQSVGVVTINENDLSYTEHLSPRQTPNMPGVYDLMYRTHIHRFPKLKLGNLDSKRDWGYAPDYTDAMWHMLQQDTPDDYVIATGETRSIRELCEAAFSCIEISDWENYVVCEDSLLRPNEVPYLKGRADKAKKKLGWEPTTTFFEMIFRMVEHDKKKAQTKAPV
jgi:GDPmannose 4,6-dehydratase